MGAPRSYRTEAVVLRRTNYGEADRILTLLTPGLGLIRAAARGARKPSSRSAGHIDLFCRSELQLAKGRDLDVLASAQMIEGYPNIRESLDRSSRAQYALEVAERLSAEQHQNLPLYVATVSLLQALEIADNPDSALHWFELAALGSSGYRPALSECAACGIVLEPEPMRLGATGAVCPRCRPHAASRALSTEALKVLRYLQRSDVLAATRLRPSDAVEAEVGRHLQWLLALAAERDIRSTVLLDAIPR